MKKNMRTRVITAGILAAVVIPFVLLGGVYFAIGVGLVAILAFKEITDLPKSHLPLTMPIAIIAEVSLLLITFCNFLDTSILWGLSYEKLIGVCLALIIPAVFYDEKKYTINDACFLIGMVLFLGIGFNSLILIRNEGLALFIYLLLIPICTDTAAYVLGCKFGKHKMMPKISPKKSWEGALSGLVIGTIIPVIMYVIFVGKFDVRIVILTFLLSILGQIGDLVFSRIKRENEIKDFSNLMPGHGGVLDRLDSTLVIFISYILLVSILF